MVPQPAIRTAIRADAFRRPVPPPAASHALDGATERDPLGQSMRLMGAVMSFPRNTEIFGENEPADYVYRVVSGSVRTYKILNDGRRQVAGFYLPGDTFGLQFADEHTFSAEAITDAKVLVVKRSALTALAGRDAAIGRELFAVTGRELRRVQDRVLLLVKSAQERVAGFLLEMAERACAGNIVELPMSRQDIADYLGLTIETISRTLTGLENVAAIEVPTSRRIVLRNRSALNRMNG
ncbi:MAG: helix-turn-helix domain-containing protein [Xanthobacteraceae bacterium]|jgi:CRP-like cAMP-binding protein